MIFLRTADMQTTTERQIRKSVENELSTDLTEQKLLVRSIVTRFLADPEQFTDVGKKRKADWKREKEEEAAAAAAAAAAEPVKPKKVSPTGPVIVIGAGPAGRFVCDCVYVSNHFAQRCFI